MGNYKTFKILTLVLFIIGFGIELYILTDTAILSFGRGSMDGGSRAEAELFLLGLYSFAKPIGFIGIILLLLNLLVDFLYQGSKIRRNELLLIGLTLMAFLPYIVDEILFHVIFSGGELVPGY